MALPRCGPQSSSSAPPQTSPSAPQARPSGPPGKPQAPELLDTMSNTIMIPCRSALKQYTSQVMVEMHICRNINKCMYSRSPCTLFDLALLVPCWPSWVHGSAAEQQQQESVQQQRATSMSSRTRMHHVSSTVSTCTCTRARVCVNACRQIGSPGTCPDRVRYGPTPGSVPGELG